MISMVSIGVGDYSAAASIEPSFESLDYAVSDAACFTDTAVDTLRMRHRWSLSSEGGADEQANRNNIIRTVVELRTVRSKGAVIYFAGHGIDVAGALHLCPQDFDPRIPGHSSISVSSLVTLLADQPGWCLLVVDACRNLPAQQRPATKSRRGGGVLVADNVCILLACSNGERSYETPSIHGESAGGVFTHFLCNSLRLTPRVHKRISVGDIFDDAQSRTSDFAAVSLQRQQTPRTVGMSPHDVFLPCL